MGKAVINDSGYALKLKQQLLHNTLSISHYFYVSRNAERVNMEATCLDEYTLLPHSNACIHHDVQKQNLLFRIQEL